MSLGDFIDRKRERRAQKPLPQQLVEWRRTDELDQAAFEQEASGCYRLNRAITGRWSEGASRSARDAGSAVTLLIPSKGSDSVLSRA
jgi:hypothetical protein